MEPRIQYATTSDGVSIALWSIGAKSLDGFLLALVIILVGAGVRILSGSLPGNRDRD